MINLVETVRKGEDSKTQFKLRFSSADALGAEISAMANSEGGIILVGVADSGEIIGVEDLQGLNQLISNVCSQKIEPPISVMTENVLHDDKRVVVISVPQGTNKPYAVNKHDFWVKVGADKRRASREELRRLMQASGTLFADEMPLPETSFSDASMYLFREFYEETYGMPFDQIGLSAENVMTNLKLAKDGHLTLAGLLLFGKKPERVKPQYLVRAVWVAGTDIGDSAYLDSEDVGGPLPIVFKNGLSFLMRCLRKEQRGQNFNTTGIMEIPQIALEEALVNALIHRDYFVNSGVRLFVFDDRVEIISPGGLPNTVTTENIRYGIQIARNPILLSFVSKLKIPYRGIGSGVMRMISECRKYDVPPPEFVENKTANFFKVVFARSELVR